MIIPSRQQIYLWLRANIFWVLLIIIASAIRLYALGSYPSQLNRDEAALAVNAHFLKQLGMDEWGIPWPIQFKSFGDYKLPGYIYILLIFFQFIESDFVVRLPAALSGIVIVIFSWYIYQKLFGSSSNNNFSKILITLFLAFSPFSIFYSRMAWEANVGLSLFLIGLWGLWPSKSVQKNQNLVPVLGILSLVASWFTYNSPFLLTPMLILVLILLYMLRKRSIIPVIFVIFCWLISAAILLPTSAQKSNVTLFQDPTIISRYPEYRFSLPSWSRPIIGNKLAYYSTIVGQNMISSFNPYFLVSHGGKHPWHSIPGYGHVFWLTYVGFIIEIFFNLYQLLNLRLKKLSIKAIIERLTIWALLIFSLVPSIITYDAPHATRSLFFLFLLTLMSSHGWLSIISFSDSKLSSSKRNLLKSVIIGVLLIEVVKYGDHYFRQWPPVFAPAMKVGLNQEIRAIPDSIKTIEVVDPSGFMYAIVAWEEKIPANQFLNSVERTQPDLVGLVEVTRMGRYRFSDKLGDADPVDWQIYWDDRMLKWQRRSL